MNSKFKELIKPAEAQTCASEARYLWSILNLYILVICICLGFRCALAYAFGVLGFRVYACREPRATSNKLCNTNPIYRKIR